MSDDWIILIPEDPRYVPDAACQARARSRLTQIAPEADEIEIKVSKHVKLFDCGANLQQIGCPACRAEIPQDWWHKRLGDDWEEQGFKLATYETPCCATTYTLHELAYEWPQGFGRFAIDAMNPGVGKLEERYKAELEGILGTRLRVIYQHL